MKGIGVLFVCATAILQVSAATAAWEHPCTVLNMEEIEAIRARVASGNEPWRSAAAKAKSIAANALGTTFSFPSCYDHTWSGGSTQRSIESRCNYPYDNHRRTAEKFGEAFHNVAMAWHLTGEQKYVDWAKKNIHSWFLDPATYMKPEVPGGTTVGIDASFSGVLVAIDLMWPAIDDQTKSKFMEWMRAFDRAHFGHRDAGMHNRGDWWACMSVVCGALSGNREAVDVGVAQMKKRLDGLKMADAGFTDRINSAIGGNYQYYILPDEGKGDATIQYNYFDIKAIHGVAEVGRHLGIDIYTSGAGAGRVSKVEGMFNYYAALMLKPTLYPNYDAHKASRGDRFLQADFNKTYGVFESLYLYKENKVYLDVVKKRGRPITINWAEGDLLYAPTLTHARGTYEFRIWGGVTTLTMAPGQPTRIPMPGFSPPAIVDLRGRVVSPHAVATPGTRIVRSVNGLPLVAFSVHKP